MGGWFKFHREWIDDPVINKDSEYLRVWIELHKMAAFDDSREVDFKGKRLRLKPGQLTAGRYQLAEATGVHPSKVKRIIERFRNDHLIDHQRSSHTSLISIVSWDESQRSDHQNDQLVTNCRPSDDHQVTTNKEMKEMNNRRNSYYSESEKERKARELDAFLDDSERRSTIGFSTSNGNL